MLEISKINATISSIIEQLLKNGRVNEDFISKYYSSFAQPSLQIGVVGKMKTGKSALVNALIFKGDILPSSSKPMTVTLTKITYGDEDSSSVEFISADDLAEIRNVANYDGNDDSKIPLRDNATEILEKLPDDYQNYLGKVIENIPNTDLESYVAADGKYSGLVKSVSMQINKPELRGITIIDTPGFNDPVSSRGETTKKFLSDCHVILFVHNEDGYDEVDGELLTSQIEYAGVSKIVEVFNRMDFWDELHSSSEWADKIADFLEDRDNYLTKEKNPQSYSLIKNSDAVAVSAYMALCGLIPKENRTDFDKRMIAEFEERFPELTDDDSATLEDALYKLSQIEQISLILNKISLDGGKYLVEKPAKFLLGKISAIIELIESDIDVVQTNLALLEQSRESALSDLKGILDFLKTVKNEIDTNSLEVRLLKNISSARSKIQETRKSESSDQFKKENFREPGVFDDILDTISKANVAAYNTFLSRYQGILRAYSEELAGSINSTCKAYIREIIHSLVNPKISEKLIEAFEKRANNKIEGLLEEITIFVKSYSIKKLPNGNTEQWSLLMSDFLSHYDDASIDELLRPYKDFAHHVDENKYILDSLVKMEEELRNELRKTPAELKISVDKEKEHLENLKEELRWTKQQILKIQEL